MSQYSVTRLPSPGRTVLVHTRFPAELSVLELLQACCQACSLSPSHVLATRPALRGLPETVAAVTIVIPPPQVPSLEDAGEGPWEYIFISVFGGKNGIIIYVYFSIPLTLTWC